MKALLLTSTVLCFAFAAQAGATPSISEVAPNFEPSKIELMLLADSDDSSDDSGSGSNSGSSSNSGGSSNSGNGSDDSDDDSDDADDSDDDSSGSGRSKQRIPDGSGCDDPGDVAEHPECSGGTGNAASGGGNILDFLSGSGRSKQRIPDGSGCDDPGDEAEHPECTPNPNNG